MDSDELHGENIVAKLISFLGKDCVQLEIVIIIHYYCYINVKGAQSNPNLTVSKKRKYFVASQDEEVRAVLGAKSGIPLIYMNQVTMVLEPPSSNSKDKNVQVLFYSHLLFATNRIISL